MLYSIEKITTLIGARRYGSADGNIRWILTDSRSVCFPEETLFFAIRSERNDGHKYIADLYRRGVRNFVVDELPEGYKWDDTELLTATGTLRVSETEGISSMASNEAVRCRVYTLSGVFVAEFETTGSAVSDAVSNHVAQPGTYVVRMETESNSPLMQTSRDPRETRPPSIRQVRLRMGLLY